MEKKIIIGVMGGGVCPETEQHTAYALGRKIALEGWVLLNGGRNAGVMKASAQGAAEAGGLTVGILPGDSDKDTAPHIHIPILTGMGHARNMINILTSDVVVACPGGAGTLSEIALALKTGTPVILLGWPPERLPNFCPENLCPRAKTPEEAILRIQAILQARMDQV